jgi:hypothetical protein
MEATQNWEALSQDFTRFNGKLNRVKSVNVNSAALREEANQLAQKYLRTVRPFLNAAGLQAEVNVLDPAFGAFLQLSEGNNALVSYKRRARVIRKNISKVKGLLAISAGSTGGAHDGPSVDEKKLIETLGKLVPSAAMSYQQALADCKDSKRISFRGPALELREALRDILDHLAPDKDVMDSDGFKLEKDRTQPTMKQKVRFILKACGQNKTTTSAPEDSAKTIEAMIADLTRSVSNFSSMASHVATERQNVIRVKRYTDALLYDLLEL